jgi:eukaryotic-like serine/threonine-protein kinase
MTHPDPAGCPSSAELERMLSDELPRDRAVVVEAHVSNCPACQTELEKLTDTPSSIGMDLSATRTGRPGGRTGTERVASPLPEIPGYQIECEIGRGGMGVVYKARQLRLNRVVALKMILAGEFASPEVALRFLAEAEIVARISHPNIVQVFDFGDVRGRAYFAMEYVEGGTLAERLDGKPWPPYEAARLIEVLAGGLHQAHKSGIIHRDLKPANILLASEGRQAATDATAERTAERALHVDFPKIADFGVAKLTEAGSGLTMSQAVVGSPNYMSPEQAEGRSAGVGPASDVHALGAVLYELLTGRRAFDGPTPLRILEQVKSQNPTMPSRLVRGLPRDVETICRACLEKDPQRRYASAELLAEDLRRFREGRPILARPIGTGRRLIRWSARHPVESALIAALFLALALGLLGTAWKWREAVRERNAVTEARVRAEQGEATATGALLDAQAARKSADEARDAWQRITSEAAFARGDDLARRGDVAAGLLWMHEGLRTAPPDDPHWADLVRKNLGGWDARLHALKHVFVLRDQAYAAALSPDGKLLLTGNGDLAEFWDTATGSLAGHLPFVAGGIQCVAFSPDGTRAAIGGGAGVHIVDVAKRGFEGDVLPTRGAAFRCAFSPDGRRLLATSRERTAPIWDVGSRHLVRELDSGNDNLIIWSGAFRSDGKQVVCGLKHRSLIGAPAEAAIWALDAAPDSPPVRRVSHRCAVLSVQFHPTDDRLLATACADGKVRLWDTSAGQLRGDPLPHPHPIVESVVFSPDGRALVTTCADGLARWWDTGSGRALGSNLRHDGSIIGASFDHAGKQLATFSADHTVRLWLVAPAALPQNAPLPSAIRAVVAPDGGRALTVSMSGLRLLDTKTGAPTGAQLDVPQSVTTSTAFAPNGRWFAAVDRNRKLTVWDMAKPIVEAVIDRSVHHVQFDSTGDRLALTGDGGIIEVWDVPGKKRLHLLQQPGIAWSATFDPPGRWLAVGSSAHESGRIWDLHAKPNPTSVPLLLRGGVSLISYRPDGQMVLAHQHRIAQLWDPATRTAIGPSIGPFDSTYQTRFDADNQTLWTMSGGRVRLWNAQSGRALANRTFDHEADVACSAVDEAAGIFVAALANRTAQFWDLARARPLGPPVAIDARPLAVARSRATGRFFAVGDDGKLHWLEIPVAATGSVDALAETLRRRTGFRMAAGAVTPMLAEEVTNAKARE